MKHRRDFLKSVAATAAATLAVAPAAAAWTAEAPASDPFAVGSAEDLVRLVDSMVEYPGGDGAMWRHRKRAIFAGAMEVLVWKRDRGRIALDAVAVLDHLELDRYAALAAEPGLPARVRGCIEACLAAIPGFDRRTPSGPWSETTLSQFDYAVMDFRKGLVAMIDGSRNSKEA